MKGIGSEQKEKVKALSKYNKVDIDLICTTLHKEFEGSSKTFIRCQLIHAFLDGKPKDKTHLTSNEQWLIFHLINNVKLYKTPHYPKQGKRKAS